MKGKVQEFVESLILYDYLLFGAVLFLFVVFIVIAILIRKRLKTAVFLVLFSFAMLIFAPIFGHEMIHEKVFAHKIELLEQKKLQFVQAIVIKAKLENISKKDFRKCKVIATVYKKSKNKYRNYLYHFKPLKKRSIVLEDIASGTTKEFKMFVEPFTYDKSYDLTLKADCR